MSGADFIALLPLLVVAYVATLLSVVLAFWRSRGAAFWLTMLTLAGAFAAIFAALPHAPRQVTPLIRVDGYSLFFSGLIIASALLITLLARDYLETHERRADAFYLLLLFAVLGMMALASSSHFASFFLAYETLSTALFGLIAYTVRWKPSIEGAVKYLILSAVASAFLAFGMALVYFELGVMDFARLAPLLAAGGLSLVTYLGLALILVGFGFKLALVPFHTWSPDVYQGAPTPVTALIASGAKAAVFALLLRMIAMADLNADRTIFILLYVLAVATMFVGNLLALLQDNVKRLLAYSSVAQLGYLLIPLIAGGVRGPSSIAFFLVSYSVTTIAAFGVVSIVSSFRATGDVDRIADYRGLALSHPFLALVMSAALFSLVGLPLTVGFFGKFYIFSAAARAGLWWLLIIGAVNSGMSAFYYLRVVFAMYASPEQESAHAWRARPAGVTGIALAFAAVVFFGVYPAPLFRLAQAAVTMLGLP